MSLAHINLVLELLEFLSDPNPQVRRISLARLLPLTCTVNHQLERNLFSRNQFIESLAKLAFDIDLIAHDALSALINLTNSSIISIRLAKIPGFLDGLVRMIINETALLSDLATMLLSNMSKVESVSVQLLASRINLTTLPATSKNAQMMAARGEGEINEYEALDLMLEVFLEGEGKKYNPNANYDFLASVFANVSTIPSGRAFLLATPSPDLEPPLAKLISFTEHPSTIRRGGVASSIKNSAFDKSAHYRLVAASHDAEPVVGAIDLLPQMLLPLCGPEAFDMDILDTLPIELQLLPSTQKREPDPAIRLILVETLVLLATTRACREAMRVRGVYEVIKMAHLAETVDKVTEPMVRLVNLLMRDEAEETESATIEELDQEEKTPVSGTILVTAEGKEVASDNTPEIVYTPLKRAEPVDSEDEDEMLLEV